MNRVFFLATASIACLANLFFAPVSFGQGSAYKVDSSGTWRWEYELNGESYKDFIRINQGKDGKVQGHYYGRPEKPVEIMDGKMEGDTLSFGFAMDFQSTPIKLQFKGKIKGDEIDGDVVVATPDGPVEFDWNPKRSVQMDDVVGNWQFKIETGDTTLEPTLEIIKSGDKFEGRYKSGGQIDVAVSNLKIEKNKLTFYVEGNADGRKIKGTYLGRPYGDKISGAIQYDLDGNTGEIEFVGARKPAAK